MKKYNLIIIALFSIFLLVQLQPIIGQEIKLEKIYSLIISISKNDTVVFQSLTSGEGFISSFPTQDTGYYIKIFSIKKEELFKANLPVSFIVITEPEIVSISKNTTLVQARMPFFLDADKIEIYHFDNLIFQYKIPKETICGNNICETGESISNCPQDCKEAPKPSETPFIIYTVFLVIVIAIVILFLKKLRIQK